MSPTASPGSARPARQQQLLDFESECDSDTTSWQRADPDAANIERLGRYVHYKRRYPHILELDETDELPPTFEQTAYCERLVGAHGSDVAARAVREGNPSVLSWLSGLTRREADFNSAQVFAKLVHHLRRPGYMAQFTGSTDGGKTNTALLMAGLALRDDPDLQLATNVDPLDWEDPNLNERTHLVECRSALKAVTTDHADVVTILDEMSVEANAQTSNYEVNEEFYLLVTYKSKYGLRLIVIGHREDGRDIAPAMRAHCTHFIRQIREERDLEDDRYHAEFYDRVEDGDPRDLQFPLRNIRRSLLGTTLMQLPSLILPVSRARQTPSMGVPAAQVH